LIGIFGLLYFQRSCPVGRSGGHTMAYPVSGLKVVLRGDNHSRQRFLSKVCGTRTLE